MRDRTLQGPSGGSRGYGVAEREGAPAMNVERGFHSEGFHPEVAEIGGNQPSTGGNTATPRVETPVVALLPVSTLPDPLATVSTREFARRDGCSHTLVARAIAAGRLRVGDDGRPFADDVGSAWRRANGGSPRTTRCSTCGSMTNHG